jgi:hydrogenase-4 component B
MVMHSQTRSMDFESFGRFLNTPGPTRNVTFLLLVAAFALKAAFFPFHTWLPRAHSAAPAHVSALLSGVVSTGAGLFGLLRFISLLGEPEPWMGWCLISFSALSAFVGALYTTSQRDLKRLLGYSSTENVGIAGIGFGLGTLGLCWHKPALVAIGFTGGLLHILNHALFKCLLFYAAGSVYRFTHSVDLERLGGLVRRIPVTAGFFLLGCLSISGLPPFNGFVSELVIYSCLINDAIPTGIARPLLASTAAVLAFVGGVSALAMTRAFGLAFLGAPRDPTVAAHEGDAPLAMQVPMGVHATFVVLLGLVPALGLRLAEEPAKLFARRLAGPTGSGSEGLAHVAQVLEPIPWLVAILAAVLASLLLVQWLLSRGAPAPRHVTWGCGYTAVNPRMQYTGASYSSQFASLFEGVLLHLRREKLPEGPFPESKGHINTHCVDAVERRIFEVLGEGEGMVSKVVSLVPNQPRFAFGMGLLVLFILVGSLVSGGVP